MVLEFAYKENLQLLLSKNHRDALIFYPLRWSDTVFKSNSSTVRSMRTLIFVFFALERNILRYLYTANSKKVVFQKSKI